MTSQRPEIAETKACEAVTKCGYCFADQPGVVSVRSMCPQHGFLRVAQACPDCIADLSHRKGRHVHLVMACEHDVVLIPTAKRLPSKQVPCPTCDAFLGEPCRGSTYGGKRPKSVQSHYARVQAAKEANRA